ncbi:MAG TPA: ABC transporter ATP-binding protein [Syntrophomonas sp.]|nr:ABC transporter ATP-binding protein [Syntrophomonas sp.]HRW12655.1 ABC transporter ATP-binding protein [Syntrophomonas sp.]
MRMLEAKSISFRYSGQPQMILENVTLSLEAGQITALTGPSGGGKSTLGYCLSGVIPTLIKGEFSGRITRQGRIGIVFQDADAQVFLPTVEDELAFGPENLCLPRQEIEDRINGILELLNIEELRLKNPARLSGGQKQLVALGGVLTLAPDIIILDETLSQLDQTVRARVKRVLLALKRQGCTIIMIEHDSRIIDIADQIWSLAEGRLQQFAWTGGEQP